MRSWRTFNGEYKPLRLDPLFFCLLLPSLLLCCSLVLCEIYTFFELFILFANCVEAYATRACCCETERAKVITLGQLPAPELVDFSPGDKLYLASLSVFCEEIKRLVSSNVERR